jgi:hypothetical protein
MSGETPDDFDAWARPYLTVLHRYAARLVGPADAGAGKQSVHGPYRSFLATYG